MGRHNAAKEANEVLNTDRREDLTLPEEYSTYRNKLIHGLAQSKSMLGGHLGLIRAVLHRSALENRTADQFT